MAVGSEKVAVPARRKISWSLTLVALRYRNFRLVWGGSIAEHAGEFMELTAVLWLVNELTHSPLWLSIVGSSRYVAMILLPPVGGVIADRINRRTLLIVSLAGMAALSAALMVMALTGTVSLAAIVVISVLFGGAMSFNHPARHTIVPNIVNKEHLLTAVSLDTMSIHVSRAIGPPIAGVIMGLFGIWPVFALRTLGCLLAVFWLLQTDIPPTPPAAREKGPWRNFTDGLGYLKANPLILILILLYALPYLAQNTYINFLPIIARDLLDVGADWYGYLQGGHGIGAAIFLTLLGLLTYYRNKFRLIIISGTVMAFGLFGLAFAATRSFSLSLGMVIVVGGMITVFSAVVNTLVQTTVTDDVRGRVVSLREILFGAGPTGSIIFGFVAQNSGVPYALGVLGAIVLGVSVLLLLIMPRYRSVG